MIYDFIRYDAEYNKIFDAIECELKHLNKRSIFVSGLCNGASDAMLCSFVMNVYSSHSSTSLILCPNEKECARTSRLLCDQGIYAPYFRSRDFVYTNISSSHSDECERIKILYSMTRNKCQAVVTTPSALLQYTIPAEVLLNNCITLEFGREYDHIALAEKLVYMGYSRTELVDSEGQFSVRGDIVDIFVPSLENDAGSAFRIEFFGDEIDRIGIFDVNTQRVVENTDSVTVIPVREVLYDFDDTRSVSKCISSLIKRESDTDKKNYLSSELASSEGGALPFADKYISLIYEKPSALLDYFDESAVCFITGSTAVRSQLDASMKLYNESVSALVYDRLVHSKYAQYSYSTQDYDYYFEKHVSVHLDSFLSGANYSKTSLIFGLRTRQSGSSSNLELLREDVENYIRAGYRIVVGCASTSEMNSLSAILRDHAITVSECYDSLPDISKIVPKAVYVTRATLKEGFELSAGRFAYVCFSEKAASDRSKLRKAKKKKFSGGKKITSYADLSEGDYVVHESYGIGIYKGLTKITSTDGITKEYITIQYAGTDKLFIPAQRLEQISKYIGAHSDDGLLKLSKMGGAEWHKQTTRAKESVKKMAKELIELYARRMRKSGFAYPADDALQAEFDSSFPYEETDSQLEAVDAIKADMMRPVPMDRLLCGDVGYGKTEVALRAAFKAVEAGKQVALLCPTTILAYQHYQTALSRFASFPVRVDMISRFRNAKEQKEIFRRLKRGDIDIIVGTHKLVYGQVEFKDLGLLIIDEEQRFGVAQKEKLKQFATDIDVLSLSATPIPRTLNMAMGGIRDMSVLDEVPGDRVPVQTYVLEYDAGVIYEAIRRELSRGGQVFYLYNKVEDINNVAARIADAVDGINVAVAHGQMDKSEIEEIWQQLVEGNID
ncbi:MAG: DEAD/DEAH box helicase, partial [Clostridia bacterium]|nr:DEAD/DEAH box helicase [Clostridia bacterium]